jgi:hypothetical protein
MDASFEIYGGAQFHGGGELRGGFDSDGARLSVIAHSVRELRVRYNSGVRFGL